MKLVRDFYPGKRVVVTGRTGFKGSWLALWLHRLGVGKQLGIAKPAESPLSNFHASSVGSLVEHAEIDVRDLNTLSAKLTEFAPDVVFHLAAQALVGVAYEDPQ